MKVPFFKILDDDPCLENPDDLRVTKTIMETSCRILTEVILFFPTVTEFRECG